MSTNKCIDIDGNVYKTVKIGDQIWMAENLKVTKYRNGDPIPKVIDHIEWSNLSSGAFCVYDNNDNYKDIYGYLYNWFAVNDKHKIAPEEWHVPTDEEWKQLEMHLGMSSIEAEVVTGGRGTDEGGKLKETGTEQWKYPNLGATNETGFSARPSGIRFDNGSFYGMNSYAGFWTSTKADNEKACRRNLTNMTSGVHRSIGTQSDGFSVRCIKD
ncbi:hypothetical protein EH223_07660 [candidate division KSB1 bacterium]|nr:fibrobacter succinogenes major paralogous domain-containing protein [candidate division KSB1 bacterium]RQW04418.1 MAG: hypothetical protein EH223_07660 [candidate division KSB1 bacterium]